jgi:hypothetical protein
MGDVDLSIDFSHREYTEEIKGTFAINHSPKRIKKRPKNPAANIPINVKTTIRIITPTPGIDIGI